MNPFQHRTKKLVGIFVTAGYPRLNSLCEQLETLNSSGVDFIEIGIPFSDPLADGPVIQRSSEVALKNGMNLRLLFDQLASLPQKKPWVLMGYFNPVLRFGIEKFLENCDRLEIRTVILPDMSPELYAHLYKSTFEKSKVRPVFLVTPTTSSNRLRFIHGLSRERFLYLVSANTTTGGKRFTLPTNDVIERIRVNCPDLPVMLGFGIRTAADVQKTHKQVDGAIIGSAYLQAIETGFEKEYLKDLVASVYRQ